MNEDTCASKYHKTKHKKRCNNYKSKHCRVWKIGNSLTRLKCETKTHTQNCVKDNETYVEDNKRAKDLRIRKQKMILVQF